MDHRFSKFSSKGISYLLWMHKEPNQRHSASQKSNQRCYSQSYFLGSVFHIVFASRDLLNGLGFRDLITSIDSILRGEGRCGRVRSKELNALFCRGRGRERGVHWIYSSPRLLIAKRRKKIMIFHRLPLIS